MAIKRDTSATLFYEVIKLVEKSGHCAKATQILDYSLAESCNVRELTDYDFDFKATVVWGRNEGIYIDCYLEGTFDTSGDKRLRAGTFKTLNTSIEAFKTMGEFAGALTYYARDYVDRNLDRYEKVRSQADGRHSYDR
ncbi:MAG: hypothetical protein KGZ53_02765 [Peptococcaceae bacterium]|nr:hypothetical protein [Peptococcaceae bacterium]